MGLCNRIHLFVEEDAHVVMASATHSGRTPLVRIQVLLSLKSKQFAIFFIPSYATETNNKPWSIDDHNSVMLHMELHRNVKEIRKYVFHDFTPVSCRQRYNKLYWFQKLTITCISIQLVHNLFATNNYFCKILLLHL